jgi:hypothetical protein
LASDLTIAADGFFDGSMNKLSDLKVEPVWKGKLIHLGTIATTVCISEHGNCTVRSPTESEMDSLGKIKE